MSHLDPATQTQLWIAIIALLTSLATLVAAIASWLRSKTNSGKLDANTALTQDIHQATNGSMTANNPGPVPPVVAPTVTTGPK